MSSGLIITFKALGLYLLITVASTLVLTTALSAAGQLTSVFWSVIFLATVNAILSAFIYRKNKHLALLPSVVTFIIINSLTQFWQGNIIGFGLLLYYSRFFPFWQNLAAFIAICQCTSAIVIKIYGNSLSSLLPAVSLIVLFIISFHNKKSLIPERLEKTPVAEIIKEKTRNIQLPRKNISTELAVIFNIISLLVFISKTRG